MHKPRRHPSTRPFMTVPRTQFYHPAKAIDAALHAIDRAIRRAEGVALVVGPPGTGKSLLLAKVAESVGEDFRVALLSGARICTRRALWQSILAEVGLPYRGIDEAELRISLAELVRSLASCGSGLAILVDEAHTLPLRLIEELRLLANMPTPLPAVHLVLAGTTALEERLGSSKMESLAQRIAVRSYLEPFDHAETVAYLRTQAKAAGLAWERLFEPGCDDAVHSLADGVPRLMNQICDQALVFVAEGRRVTPADIATAWQEIQRLPSTAVFGHRAAEPMPEPVLGADPLAEGGCGREFDGEGGIGVIEFGSLDDEFSTGARPPVERAVGGGSDDAVAVGGGADPWHGPDVEFVFDAATDPFQEFFEQEERVVERYLVGAPDDFSRHRHVSSAEGAALVRELMEREEGGRGAGDAVGPQASGGGEPWRCGAAGGTPVPAERAAGGSEAGGVATSDDDDTDMVVIEEDFVVQGGGRPAVSAVRLGDYRRLFARLRRGG